MRLNGSWPRLSGNIDAALATNEVPFGCTHGCGWRCLAAPLDLICEGVKSAYMIAAAKLAADPLWIPHRIDLAARRVQFLHVPATAFGEATFLADRTPNQSTDEEWASFDEVCTMQPETGPVHFIFHTAFCRSTLLVRALHIPGVSAGLNEPAIIADLVSGDDTVADLVGPCLRLLSRPHAPGEAVFIKPTNLANRILPAAMQACPDAKAILMSHPLDDFLNAIYRRGLMGRRWARQLYLDLQQYAPLDLQMDERETFSLTDMLVAGLGWFMQQRWFAMNMAGELGARMRVLDGNSFNANRAETLAAIAAFTGMELSADQAEAAATGELFQQHAKLGGDFAAREEQDHTRSRSTVGNEEAAMVGEWLGQIIGQSGQPIPLKQTLF